MSDNEMDQIGRESSRALREILNVARTWIEAHRNRNRYSGVRKLTRRERRDLAEAVRIEVGERRIAGAWADLRVSDYHREARELDWARTHMDLSRPDNQQWLAERTDRLDAIRHRIEHTLHTTALPLEQRGQVVQALDQIERRPAAVRIERRFQTFSQQTQQCPPDQPTETRPTQAHLVAAPEPVAPEAKHPDRLAEIEREVRGLREDRDQLARRVEILQRGVDAVTADRDDHKRKLAAATAQVEALKNTNLAQARELEDLRQNGLRLVEVTVERDKYRTERDEAVQKLAHATPRQDRYGSEERVDIEQTAREDTALRDGVRQMDNGRRYEPIPRPARPHRNGIERSR
ncbi:hypothetical protein [Nocardia sp. 852002-51244_SCH5132740]|uniref:hypothetical protein n=1 Tax=Nocardia sp. 852002-51244_SCH5132740 TaxID=1834099 RepID=UPI0007EA8431|nr:hypothetical protein [Nocardia sp. 852002-51244_SCH5132740]OBB47631.1 hypothetical protein A5748_22615 [Nocardia sp. 852002-51244_SCH5132740]